MTRSHVIRAAALVVLATFLALASAVSNAAETTTASSAQLLSSAQRAVGQLVVTAGHDPAFKSRDGKSKPFWDGLRTANDNLANAATSASLKSDKFTEQLAAAMAAVEQADIARIMNGGGSKELAQQTGQLQKIVQRLNENYGPYAAREKVGGSLTANEKAQLEKLRGQQAELETKLNQVEKNLGKNNADIQQGIDRIRENSRKIRRSRNNVAGYVGGFWAAHWMASSLWGWHWWWGPWGVWCPGYVNVNIDIWVDGWDDLDYDWGLLELESDVADLDLEDMDIGDEALAEADALLTDTDFSLDDGDMRQLTEDLPGGWDDVTTDAGSEAMERMESNSAQAPFEGGAEIEAIDHGPADFGGDFDGGMDF